MVDDWDSLPDQQQALFIDIEHQHLACPVCMEYVESIGVVNDIEGTAEDFTFVGKAYALPCGCRQEHAYVEPEALEMVFAQDGENIVFQTEEEPPPWPPLPPG